MTEPFSDSIKPKICIVAHNAFGTLAKVDKGHIGGIEVQTPLMAKWLAQNGYSVSLVCWDQGQEDGIIINDIHVNKMCAESHGLPLLRFFWPRWSSLNKVLTKVKPDIIYYNCGDLGLGQCCLWARRYKRKVIYSVANDPDCKKDLPALKPMRERLLYRYGLKHADEIVVQTLTQQQLLQNDFNRQATVIPMPSQGFKPDRPASFDPSKNPRLLWVGRFTKQKRLDWLLELAVLLPQITFDVVGSDNENSTFSKNLLNRAKDIKNVNLCGRIAHDDMGRFYNNASLLLCTSAWEGFPNVFLEAWSTGLPIVTSFDPDKVVEKHKLGLCVEDLNEFPDAIKRMLAPENWFHFSKAALDYYQRFHTVESSMKSFEKVFMKSFQTLQIGT